MTNKPETRLVMQDVASPQEITGRMVEVYEAGFGPLSVYGEAYEPGEVEGILSGIMDTGIVRAGIQDGKVVALAAATPGRSGRMMIEELVVDPDRWGQGYGREMLEDILQQAGRLGCSGAELRTSTKNARAIGLYESVGFGAVRGNVLVPQTLAGGKVGVDERVYMAFPPLTAEEQAARYTELKRVVIGYPSGNTTAVIFDQIDQFPDLDRKQLNSDVMKAFKRDNPDKSEVEQCCFVAGPKDPRAVCRVEMLGGEFCGNATRTVAWLVAGGRDYEGLIEVSGVDRPLNFSVKDGIVGVEMPLPKDGELVREVPEGSLVALDGISQLVVTDPEKRRSRSARELLSTLLTENKYGLADLPAVGVSYFDKQTGKADFCVWVNAVDTIFDETACGSGTSAIGIAVSKQQGASATLEVVQPSGEAITSMARFEDGKVVESRIAGRVSVLQDGALKLR